MSEDINPTVPDLDVRVIDDPGRRGKTTGKTKKLGSLILVEIAFGPNDKEYLPRRAIETVANREDSQSLFAKGSFGGPKDLRRILTFRKVKGDLTNVFYSMESSNTDFYPHQFKPVLSFIESVTGRLLIADEVGLGKTIESIYIWKELQAREDARRLLIVCPAMLREKWKLDLRNRFNINAEVVNAARVLEESERVVSGENGLAFSLIVSLEGMRPPKKWQEDAAGSTRARLARLLDLTPQTTALSPIFHLVIIDEAHYLRNPETMNNRLGRLLRDAAQNLLLLTATPIQTHARNLYNLLRLIDQDFFVNEESFNSLLESNRSIVSALRALWSAKPDFEAASAHLQLALQTAEFGPDPALTRAWEALKERDALTVEEKVEIGRMVETRSLLSHYMSRTRKRDAFEKRVIRDPHVREFRYSEPEARIYNIVSERIREMSRDTDEIDIFRLIARQRQMASSMVAAIRAWDEKGVLDEYLWEDFGVFFEDNADDGIEQDTALAAGLRDTISQTDLRQLEEVDDKYRVLRELISGVVSQGRKIVIFAFYRNTLRYLNDRLVRDGIRCSLILGGMGDEKYQQIEQFRDPAGTQVLLSSEVGSEGIDLQFCSALVNYDLPWNPMRVEQRIGRIDRLGQKEEKIFIYNFYNTETIEDRILKRLYERLDIFRNSIGDLEEILGDVENQLFDILLKPDLTEEERTEQAEQTTMAIRNRGLQQNRLEEEAVNLVGFTDYLLDTIKETKDQGRWIDTEDLRSFVSDFVSARYPGSIIAKSGNDSVFNVTLSKEAKDSIANLIKRSRLPVNTGLHRSRTPIPVVFDPRLREQAPRGTEIVSVQHPIIRWISEAYENDGEAFHTVVAGIVAWTHELGIDPGDYVFAAERWEISGLRSRVMLSFQVASVGTEEMMSPNISERLVTLTARDGKTMVNAVNNIDNLARAEVLVRHCEEQLTHRLSRIYDNAKAENEALCRQVEMAARRYSERRITQHRELIDQFSATGRNSLIPMREGLVRSEEHARDEKLRKIEKQRDVRVQTSELAKGFIRVQRGSA